MVRLVGEVGDHDPLDPSRRASSAPSRTGRGSAGAPGVRPWSFIAIALASHGPTQTISSRPRRPRQDQHVAAGRHVHAHALDDHLDLGAAVSGHGRIIPRGRRPAARPVATQRGARLAPTGTGARAARRRRTRRCGRRTRRPAARRRRRPATTPSISWSANQNPSTITAGHGDQLVEEPQEHQRLDPRAAGTARGRRPAPRRSRRTRRPSAPSDVGSTEHLGQRRGDAADQVEGEEREPTHPVLDVVAEDPQEQHVAEQVEPAARAGTCWSRGRARAARRARRPARRGQVGRDDAVAGRRTRRAPRRRPGAGRTARSEGDEHSDDQRRA